MLKNISRMLYERTLPKLICAEHGRHHVGNMTIAHLSTDALRSWIELRENTINQITCGRDELLDTLRRELRSAKNLYADQVKQQRMTQQRLKQH